MRCFNKDEEWGFFVDLEVDYENITKKIIQPIKTIKSNPRKNSNYMTAIYEEDYWYEKDELYYDSGGECEIKKNIQSAGTNKNENEIYEKKMQTTTITMIVCCLFCASIISWSLIFKPNN